MSQKVTVSFPIHTMGVHAGPHPDETFGMWQVKNFGNDHFPGAMTATIVCGFDTQGRSGDDWLKEGVLLFGIGGGMFDEHSTTRKNRKEGECVASLVAQYLGIAGEPWMKQVLSYVVDDDLNGSPSGFDIGAISKLIHQMYPDDPDLAMEWTMTALAAKMKEQLSFWKEARTDFSTKSTIYPFIGPKGAPMQLALVRSDNPQVGKFGRSKVGGNCNVVIQLTSSGNVQIFTANGLTLYDAVAALRYELQSAKGKMLTTDWDELALEGKVEGAEEIYFQERGQMLLNGSLTAKNVEPLTKWLAIERIVELVILGVSPSTFHPDRASNCKQWKCTSTEANPCPWYGYGLRRCTDTQDQMRQLATTVRVTGNVDW